MAGQASISGRRDNENPSWRREIDRSCPAAPRHGPHDTVTRKLARRVQVFRRGRTYPPPETGHDITLPSEGRASAPSFFQRLFSNGSTPASRCIPHHCCPTKSLLPREKARMRGEWRSHSKWLIHQPSPWPSVTASCVTLPATWPRPASRPVSGLTFSM